MALSSSYLANFQGTSVQPFLILSTGVATDVTNVNTSGSQGTDHSPSGVSGDKATLTFTIAKPADATAFTFDFTFLSEEFPEYVGSSYNDYFSVKVNGVEAARDTSGNPISVNNNFFSGQYSPTGTFFDGQTPPLKITAPIDKNATTVQVVLEIADAGDGIYDSAAFIKNIGFLKPQKVFLDFNAGFLEFASAASTKTGFNLPGSGLTEAQQDAIIAKLDVIYKDFMIEFVRTKPASGEYSTIHVGGTASDLPAYLNASSGLLGRAEKIDYGNVDRSDAAFVLSGHSAMMPGGSPNLDLITQVIAHEGGHILGLRHIGDSTELMYPFAGASRTTIGGVENLSEISNGVVVPVGGTQDSYMELVRNLGLKASSNLVVAESTFSGIVKYFNFSFDSSLDTFYGVKIIIATEENEVVQVIDVGNMDGDGIQELVIPATTTDKAVVMGKSKPNGPYDLFLTPNGVKSFNFTAAGEIGMLEKLGIGVDDLDDGALTIAKLGGNGKFTSVGSLSATVVDVTASDPTMGPDVLIGADLVNDNMAGLAGDDRISGFSGKDKLFGNEGNDTLIGGLHKDTLDGGDGDDVLIGGAGKDNLVGAAGKDTASYADAGAGVTASLATPSSNKGDAKGDSYDSIENLWGSIYADKLTGDGKANAIWGDAGKDTIDGGAKSDTISGGLGKDQLTGGAGKDFFLFDVAAGKPTADKIVDFNVKDDTIQLDDAVYSALALGPLAQDAFHKSKVGVAHDADDRIIYDKDSGRIFYDADGDGVGVGLLIATIGKNLSLTYKDFEIV